MTNTIEAECVGSKLGQIYKLFRDMRSLGLSEGIRAVEVCPLRKVIEEQTDPKELRDIEVLPDYKDYAVSKLRRGMPGLRGLPVNDGEIGAKGTFHWRIHS